MLRNQRIKLGKRQRIEVRLEGEAGQGDAEGVVEGSEGGAGVEEEDFDMLSEVVECDNAIREPLEQFASFARSLDKCWSSIKLSCASNQGRGQPGGHRSCVSYQVCKAFYLA